MPWYTNKAFWLGFAIFVLTMLVLGMLNARRGRKQTKLTFLPNRPTMDLLESIRKRHEQIFHHPCDLGDVLATATGVVAVLVEEVVDGGTFFVRRADGNLYPLELGFPPLHDS